jgi:hypothetical protein
MLNVLREGGARREERLVVGELSQALDQNSALDAECRFGISAEYRIN